MAYGICNLSIVPIRTEPAHRSEQVSQLLFGETFTITDQQNEWVKIKTSYDDYDGWIQKAQYLPIELTQYNELQKSTPFLSYDLVQILINHQQLFSIVPRSTLTPNWWPFRRGRTRNGHTLNIGNIRTSFPFSLSFIAKTAPPPSSNG